MSAGGRTRIRPKIDHAAANQEALDNPGVWVRVGEYNSRLSADSVAHQIDGTYPNPKTAPYAPVGCYTTELRNTELYTEVWIMYEEREQ